MVDRKILIIIIATLICGCCYSGPKSIYGLPRKKIEAFKEFENYNDVIDTTALYKLEINYFYNSSLKKYTYYEKEKDIEYSYASYLKFYDKGKMGVFIILKKDTAKLNRSFFEPAKAKMGYYKVDKLGKVYYRISTIGDCSLYISNKTGYVKRDSLFLQDHYGGIYVKKKVPENWLKNWNPDW